MEAGHAAGRLFEVERSEYYAERPGFRIAELQIGPRQMVPWHYHTSVQDTFFVITGRLSIFLGEPKQEILLGNLCTGRRYAV